MSSPPSSSTKIHRDVEAARAGENPRIICRTHSGWLVAGERQILRGYCLLLPDPVVTDLNALGGAERFRFLSEMATIGDALLVATGAARINYEILGNLEPALHAHIIPRYTDEPEATRTRPVWVHAWDEAPLYDPARDGALFRDVRQRLASIGVARA